MRQYEDVQFGEFPQFSWDLAVQPRALKVNIRDPFRCPFYFDSPPCFYIDVSVPIEDVPRVQGGFGCEERGAVSHEFSVAPGSGHCRAVLA